MTGAVGNAEWTGVALRDVLTRAGIREDAVSVLLMGLDVDAPEEGFRRVCRLRSHASRHTAGLCHER